MKKRNILMFFFVTQNKITGLTPLENKIILTPNMYIAHGYSILSVQTT